MTLSLLSVVITKEKLQAFNSSIFLASFPVFSQLLVGSPPLWNILCTTDVLARFLAKVFVFCLPLVPFVPASGYGERERELIVLLNRIIVATSILIVIAYDSMLFFLTGGVCRSLSILALIQLFYGMVDKVRDSLAVYTFNFNSCSCYHLLF